MWAVLIACVVLPVTVARLRSTADRMRRLYAGDPSLMCSGCRARAIHLHQTLSWVDSAGPAWGGLVWAGEAVYGPLVPAIRRLAGRDPMPRCTGPECVAHPQHAP